MKRRLLLFLLLSFGFLHGAKIDKDDVWFKTFYRTQEVKKFDRFWKKVVADKLLEQTNSAPPMVGFANRVVHQYPGLLKGRLDDLKKFPPKQLKAVMDLLWLCDTPEAREILKANGYPEYLSRPVPPIGARPINEAGDLDFCWGWFFATGDTAALDPIVSTLDFGKYAGAAKNYQASQKTEDDRDTAYKDALFGAAMWSLGANARDDAKIAGYLESTFANPDTPQSRTMWLAVILSQLKPDKYKVELSENSTDRSTTMKVTARPSATTEGVIPPKEFDTINATLARVAKHAKDYPPQFASDKERKQIEKELKQTISSLAKALDQHPDNPVLLSLDGFANAMGHNLDLPGCPDRCINSYERLLELQPENGMAHFYYGGFLAGTATHQKESVVHLEKAIALGVTDAHYTLGFALLLLQDKEGALQHLHEFARLNPTNERVKQVIEHINKSEIRIQRTGGKSP